MDVSLRLDIGRRSEELQRLISEAAAPVNTADLSLDRDTLLHPAGMVSRCREVAAIAGAAGLRATALRMPRWRDINSAMEPSTQLADWRQEVLAALDAATELGIRSVGLERPPPCRNARHEDIHWWMLDALLALRFEAETRGITLIVPCGGRDFLASPVEAREFIDEVNSAWVGSAVDVGAIGGIERLSDWVQTLAGQLRELRVERGALIAESTESLDGVLQEACHARSAPRWVFDDGRDAAALLSGRDHPSG